MPENKQPDRIVSSKEMYEEIQTIEPQKCFQTGYYYLDEMTQGFKEGDLVILSGLTGAGKTEYSISLAKRFIEQDNFPLFFSYEISNTELFERFGQPVPLFYLPRSIKGYGKPTEWLEKKIIEAKQLDNIKVVFIDHLHYLVDYMTTRAKNTSEMLGYMCREFKQIARRQRVVIFLLAHVRKYNTTRPTMQDIKDSSGIVQEADAVMIINRKGRKRSRKSQQDLEDDDEIPISNEAYLYIDKVRRRGGKIGKIKLIFEDNLYKEL